MVKIDQKSAKKRIEQLKSELKKWNYHYFTLDEEIFPEAARDSLKRELEELESQFPALITADSPTQRVGAALSGRLKKFKHLSRKYSLQDAFSLDEVAAWQERIQKLVPDQEIHFIAEPKIDGLNITVHYEAGEFVRALTRGDGQIGEDVSHTIRTINSLPLVLNQKLTFEVSGEVYMTKADFAELNKKSEQKYMNPRNVAAGSVRQLDPQIAAERNLRIAFYSLGQHQFPSDIEPQKQSEVLDFFRKLNLPVNPLYHYCNDLSDIGKFYKKLLKDRDKLAFDIDGLVLKVNDFAQQELMGRTAKTPRYALALKFPATQASSQILDITIQVGRTGALTPVAELKPVFVDGTTVSRATLHNEEEIERKDIRIGDTVIIQKAGDIIPEVVQVLTEMRNGAEKKYKMPKSCPVCDTVTEKPEGEAVRRCPNEHCPARQQEGISHYVSRAGMNLDGVGPKVIAQLLDQQLISTAADLYFLTEADLVNLPLFQDKKVQNVLSSIATSLKRPLHQFLFALGIRFIGAQTARDLAQFIAQKSKDKSIKPAGLFKLLNQIELEELGAIEGIGDKVASAVYEWFHDHGNQKLLERFDAGGLALELPAANTAGKLSGLTFVVTGSFAEASREEIKQEISVNGGKVSSSVSKNTDYLVVGENPGSKLAKAEQLSIKILDLNALQKMVKSAIV